MAVVTLQIGSYANTIGAHLWNIRYGCIENNAKDDDSHSSAQCLFREEPSSKEGSVFSPRLVAVDVKEHMTTPHQPPEVIKEEEHLSWSGKHTKVVQDNSFVPEDDLNWSELLHRPLPESSLLPVLLPAAHRSLQLYSWGQMTAADRKWAETLEDRLHPLLEECDQLQGFQIVADGHDGFGGVAGGVAETLYEEFGQSRLLMCPCFPSSWDTELAPATSILNSFLLTNQVISSCGLVIPLSMSRSLWPRPSDHTHSPYLDYEVHQPNHPCHTAPILAVAMDTAVLGYQDCLQQTITGLSSGNRKMAMLSGFLPLPLTRGSSLVYSLNHAPSACIPFTPYLGKGALWDHRSVVRGIPKDYIIDPDAPTRTAADVYCALAAPALSHLPHVKVLERPLQLPADCPPLLCRQSADLLLEHGKQGSKVPMATSIFSGADSHLLLGDLLKSTLSLNIASMHSFGVTKEELSEAQQNITTLQSSYCDERSQELENDD